MKKSYIIPVAIGSLMLASCAEEYHSDLVVDKPESVEVAERLAQLDVLNSYVDRTQNPNFVLGLAVNAEDYANQALTYSIAKTNFDAVVDASTLLYGNNVADDGVMTFGNLSNMFIEGAPTVLGGPMYAYNGLNKAQLETVISANFVKGDLQEGKLVLVDFDSDAVGTTVAMSGNGVATVVEDPKGESGNVLQVGAPDNKAKNSYALVNVSLPNGLTLGNLKTVYFDLMLIDETSSKKNLVMIMADVRKTYTGDTPAKRGCPVNEWARKLIELNVSDLELTEAQLGLSSFAIAVGPNVVNSYYYIDNISCTWETGVPDKYVEKTPAEKSQALADNFDAYANALMAVSAPKVSDYVVVANPMSDDEAYMQRDAENETDLGLETANSFFLNDYMGDNYVATLTASIKKAYAANGGAGSLKLYVRESNLLGNPGKVERLVRQINEWTAAGAQIDGIAVELPLAYSTVNTTQSANQNAVTALFKALASTGKVIRIDNLSMTNANADYYKFVIGEYMSLVPADKRGGIIFAGTGELWNAATRTVIYEAVTQALK